jgi:hypothetical protein
MAGWKPDRAQLLAALLAVILSAMTSSALRTVAPTALSGWSGAFISAALLVGLYIVFIQLLRRPRSH